MSSVKIEAQCPAKINLTFDIKGILNDGYHEVETLYQAVSLYDRLVFDCRQGESFAVKINTTGNAPHEFPQAQDNIIYKAADAFRRRLSGTKDFALEVTIDKKIPIGAGLGGGSSNAAATLMSLNRMFNEIFSHDDLSGIAQTLGADIPFFITGGLCLGTARGDKLQPLNPLPQLWIVLVKPKKISVQTKWAYTQFDEYVAARGNSGLPRPDWRAFTKNLQPDKLGNVFEPPIFEHYPLLAELKHAIESAGATCCHMTGSGSALYGLASSETQAHNIADELSLSLKPFNVDIFLVHSVEQGVQLGDVR
jgi:4-diphosphocytidyl-2-C-methyl-D-erythritol kinase